MPARPEPGPAALTRRRMLGVTAAGAAGVVAAACGGDDELPAAPPWPQRPVVELALDVAGDLRSVTGRESVRFTPDAAVTELVFRAWPNTPEGARAGNALVVTGAAVDGVPVAPRTDAGGAPPDAPGTLVTLPLPRGSSPPGVALDIDLAFTVTLGADATERTGTSPDTRTAWLGTAFPLLAWVRGRGWVRDDAVDLPGETVTSEEFRLAGLTVTADAGSTVVGMGREAGAVPAPPGRVARRFTADAVRDVAVAVGDYALTEARAGAVRVHVATPRAGTRVPGAAWADRITRGIPQLSGLLGPFPYDDLWATVVPTETDGVEFPTAVQFGDHPRTDLGSLVDHELAHQWFYSLVGNDQALDPWIDESFATLAQAVAAGETGSYRLADVDDSVRGRVGRPMSYWAAAGDFRHYVAGVYDQGTAALLAGRARVGADRFDRALRDYLARHAHRVVGPADVRAAFADLPEVTDLLVRVGALPSADRRSPR